MIQPIFLLVCECVCWGSLKLGVGCPWLNATYLFSLLLKTRNYHHTLHMNEIFVKLFKKNFVSTSIRAVFILTEGTEDRTLQTEALICKNAFIM